MLSPTMYPAANSAGTETVRRRCSRQHQAGKGYGERHGQHMRTLDKRRERKQAEDAFRDTERLEPKRQRSECRGFPISYHGQAVSSIITEAPGEQRGPQPFLSLMRNMVSLYRSSAYRQR